jgi:hypothetical protein
LSSLVATDFDHQQHGTTRNNFPPGLRMLFAATTIKNRVQQNQPRGTKKFAKMNTIQEKRQRGQTDDNLLVAIDQQSIKGHNATPSRRSRL